MPEWIDGASIEIADTLYRIVSRTATTVTVGGTPVVSTGAAYRGASVVDPELGVDVLGVRAHRAQRDAELARDVRPVED